MSIFENIFRFKDNNTNLKTEILAGITTFFTMSYMFVLSPKILEQAGLDFTSTVTVTGLVVFICSLIMGLIANKPFAVAPFLGETAFIAFTLVCSLGFSIKTALAAILICGVILLFMTIFNLRTYIVNQIPESIKLAFCTGLGLFFMFIALKDIGIVNFTKNQIPLETGNFTSLNVILGIFCFTLLIILVQKKIKAAVIIAIATTTIIGILLGDVKLPQSIIALPCSISSSFMQIDFSNLFSKDFLPMLFVIFLLVNIDTAGAIVGLSYKANFIDEQGKIKDLKKTMLADSLAVIIAPFFGTTTPGAYLDSMTGISEGGRTGLTAVTVGCLFLFGLLFTPLIMIIPSYAYAPALLYVGILMISVIKQIDSDDITQWAPAVFPIAVMIFTYNIGTGIIAGFLIHPVIKLLCGKKNETNIISWIMFAVSVVFFIIYPY